MSRALAMPDFRRGVLDRLRRMFHVPSLERRLVTHTVGRPYRGFVSRLPPNPNSYRPGTMRTVDRFGLSLSLDLSDLVDWYAYWGFIDPSIERLLALCPPNADVLDVGANNGLSVLRLASRTSGRVVGIEPDPGNFERLRHNVEVNRATNCEIVNVGLSDRIGTAYLERPELHNRGMHRVSTRGLPIPVTTLDALVREKQVDEVRLIKIDVEGHECHVLRGAVDTLRRWRPLLFVELADGLLRLHSSSGPDLVRLIESLGYAATDAASGRPVRPADALGPAMDLVCEWSGGAPAP